MSGSERKIRRGVTPRSPEGTRMLPKGAFESALLILREAFLEETIGGVEDSAFWLAIEEKATLTVKQACFQYYMIGVGHTKLAELCLNHFLPLKAGIQLGNVNEEQQRNYLARASYFYLEEYPPRYKAKYS